MKPSDTDLLLQGHTPVAVVPRFGEFEALTTHGHRFLVDRDGLWIEARRPWAHVIWPLARQDSTPMPHGALTPVVQLAFDRLPVEALEAFVRDARKHHPAEVGAVVTWNERDGSMRYRLCDVLSAGVGHLRQRWPAFDEGEHPVLDLHSHGPLAAFFSDTDRRDTGTDVVVAGVVGQLDEPRPQLALSLFACGVEIPVDVPLGPWRAVGRAPALDGETDTGERYEDRGG